MSATDPEKKYKSTMTHLISLKYVTPEFSDKASNHFVDLQNRQLTKTYFINLIEKQIDWKTFIFKNAGQVSAKSWQ